jgi:hypothetical protein
MYWVEGMSAIWHLRRAGASPSPSPFPLRAVFVRTACRLPKGRHDVVADARGKRLEVANLARAVLVGSADPRVEAGPLCHLEFLSLRVLETQ